MRDGKWKWGLLPIALVLGLIWYEFGLSMREPAAPPPAPGMASAPSTPLDEPALTTANLVRNLTSDDPAIRRAAAEFLAQLPYQQRPWLSRTLAETGDPAVKPQLEQRLDAIDELLATRPPPISLHVKDASLYDVITALNEEMGTDLKPWPPNGNPVRPGTYTLDVTDQPFWEVIAALDRQRPFQISAETVVGIAGGGVGHVLLVGDNEAGMGHHAISGPFFCYAYGQLKQGPVDPTGGGGPQNAEFNLSYVILCDPRLPIVDLAFDTNGATPGPDSNGNPLDKMPRVGRAEAHAAISGYHGYFSGKRPANAGTSVTSLKVAAQFTTAVPAASLEVPDIEQKSGWEGKFGDVTVRMPRMTQQSHGDSSHCDFEFTISPPEQAPLVTLFLFEPDGRMPWSKNARFIFKNGPIGTDGVVPGDAWLPHPQFAGTLQVALAKRTHDFSASFEIKDIPLAPKP